MHGTFIVSKHLMAYVLRVAYIMLNSCYVIRHYDKTPKAFYHIIWNLLSNSDLKNQHIQTNSTMMNSARFECISNYALGHDKQCKKEKREQA